MTKLEPVPLPAYYEGGSPVLGYKNALITINMYSDFTSVDCKREALILRNLLDDYSDTLRIIYKHFPNKENELAMDAAQSAQSAAFQGYFWGMHDEMFNNQNELSYRLYSKIAQKLGLNAKDFTENLVNSASSVVIDANISEGKRLGVNRVPSIIINGNTLLSGYQSEEEIRRVIDSKLIEKTTAQQ